MQILSFSLTQCNTCMVARL